MHDPLYDRFRQVLEEEVWLGSRLGRWMAEHLAQIEALPVSRKRALARASSRSTQADAARDLHVARGLCTQILDLLDRGLLPRPHDNPLALEGRLPAADHRVQQGNVQGRSV